jgi:dihydrofolate reductase
MQINIIAACDRNAVIGKNGKLPFRIKEDMQRFRELTLVHAVIMGRKTFESLNSKSLVNRDNYIINSKAKGSRGKSRKDGIQFFLPSIESALIHANSIYNVKAWIIGGERLYTEALPLADRVYLTLVDTEVEVGPEDTVARFPLEQMKSLFRMEREDKRDGFTFTEWVRQ